MYDLLGDPITMDIGLLYVLLTLRLGFDFHVQLWDIAVNFIRKAGRK